MPELPEVETVMRALKPLMVGRKIICATQRVPRLRTDLPPKFSEHLTGRTILQLSRRAKYILMTLSEHRTLIVHLGMTGGFYVRSFDDPPKKHDHILLDLDHDLRLSFHDPRRFGQLDLIETRHLDQYPSLMKLGPEPLSDDFTPTCLRERLANKKGPIKTVLLDQQVLVGLGNIYVAEALFYAKIHPCRPAGSLHPTELERLYIQIRRVLNTAIEAGGSTLRDYRHPDGELGFFQDQFAVYGRTGEKCPGCTCQIAKTGGITRLVQAGRSTFFCAQKQK